jgi:hypothetical protein
MFAQSVLHAGESKNQADRPKTHQRDQRQRPKISQEALAPVRGFDVPPNSGPEAPAIPVEPTTVSNASIRMMKIRTMPKIDANQCIRDEIQMKRK